MALALFLTWAATLAYAFHLHRRVDRLDRRLRSLRAHATAATICYAHTHDIHLHYDE